MLVVMARVSLAVVMVIATVAVAGCGDDGAEKASGATPDSFVKCSDLEGGGYDVWVQGMDCADATTELLLSMPDAFGRYKSLSQSERITSNQGPDGWTCWAALESDFGPIHNVCRRGDQTLIFYEG